MVGGAYAKAYVHHGFRWEREPQPRSLLGGAFFMLGGLGWSAVPVFFFFFSVFGIPDRCLSIILLVSVVLLLSSPFCQGCILYVVSIFVLLFYISSQPNSQQQAKPWAQVSCLPFFPPVQQYTPWFWAGGGGSFSLPTAGWWSSNLTAMKVLFATINTYYEYSMYLVYRT